MEEVVQIPARVFQRMSEALIGVEKFLGEKKKEREQWLTTAEALKLLGCKKSRLYQIKDQPGGIISNKIGKERRYSRSSIESYNKLMSC